jgi:hypothetical protein
MFDCIKTAAQIRVFTPRAIKVTQRHSASSQTVSAGILADGICNFSPCCVIEIGISEHSGLRRWLKHVGVATLFIEPGSPWENGYAESFHSRFRDEFLAMEIFDGLHAARVLTTAWRHDYNTQRPHSSLDYMTPAEFAAACADSTSAKASVPAAQAETHGPTRS